MSAAYDVVVIGGGFAGCTAARELQQAGHRTVVLEGRDRLGGRTWTSSFAGRQVEMGGTWVHWHQPHVWAEIRRYGLEVTEAKPPTTAAWLVGRELKQGPPEELWRILVDGTDRMCHDARVHFERPHDPFYGDPSAIDGLSIQDRVDELGFDRETLDVNDAMWGTCCSAHVSETGLAAALRWYALSGHSFQLLMDCIARYKLVTGTKSLVEAIAADGRFDIRYETPVAAVEQEGDRVAVHTRDGETIEARAVVVAVPLNALGAIEFRPVLSSGKQAAAGEGQSSHGIKVWIRVRGDHDYFAVAPTTSGLTFLQSEYKVDGDTLFVSFGSDADALDPADQDAVVGAAQELLPSHEIVDTHAHNWTGDEFTQGTWSMYRPNQLTRYLRELQQPEGRVFLATSDVANGWNGFIDGAIESGLETSRKVVPLLS
jgi:pseudooxynicotine dehydrogenase